MTEEIGGRLPHPRPALDAVRDVLHARFALARHGEVKGKAERPANCVHGLVVGRQADTRSHDTATLAAVLQNGDSRDGEFLHLTPFHAFTIATRRCHATETVGASGSAAKLAQPRKRKLFLGVALSRQVGIVNPC